MRILNRPMFRYGGPIKEGIMHGVRSNYAGGRRAALVGDPVFPRDSSGRSHHAVQALAAVPWLLRAASIPFGRWATQQGLRKGVTAVGGGPGQIRMGLGRFRDLKPGETYLNTLTQAKNKFTPYKFWSQDPLYKAGATGAGWAGKGLKKGYKIAKAGVTTPSGIATTGGLAWMFWPDGTPKTKAEINASGGPKPWEANEGMQGTGEWFAAQQAEKDKNKAAKMAAEAKAARTAKLEKYLDTMGYDKAKKGALGDALIDASAIVQDATSEAGSLKKADWGKMINKAIQTTSKRLDKPEQIREAVGLMLTKSEIEKDLEDPQVKRLRALQIEDAEEKLNRGFEKDMREFILARKEAPDKNQLERFARLTADEYEIDFKKISDEDIAKVPEGATEEERMQIVGMTDDGIYMIGGDIVRVTGGIPKQIA